MQDGAENLTQIIISAEKQKDTAAQVAADATVSATKSRETYTELLLSIQSEITHVRHESLLFQVKFF